MIYLLAAAVVILPLVLLDCIKRAEKPEPSLLPFSVVDSAPPGTSKEAISTALKAPLHTPPPPPPPPQPPSDGVKGGDTVTSTTKNNTTDKQTASARTDKHIPLPLPARPEEFNSFVRRKRTPHTPQQLAMIEQYKKEEAAAEAAAAASLDDNEKQRRRVSPSDRRRKKYSPSPGSISPKARTAGTAPLGSKKAQSRKSRKNNIPRSPSWKELQSRAKNRTPVTKSKMEVGIVPSSVDVANNGSTMTALSEYAFRENRHQVLGKVDYVIETSDEAAMQHAALNTRQSMTALTHSERARSPFFDGTFSVWIADRVGSQADG